MKPNCPNPNCDSHIISSHLQTKIIKDGTYFRVSDSRKIQCFRCKSCGKRFSAATGSDCFAQNKRRLNTPFLKLISSGVSLRRSAIILQTTRKTLSRKLKFLSKICERDNQIFLKSQPPVNGVQFDEMESFEHTKCKPLAIALAVHDKTRHILGFEVSQMPAKGPLAEISRVKYGKRKSFRKKGLTKLLKTIKPFLAEKVHLKSDECPFYNSVVKNVFADKTVTYDQFKGGRGCITGQGELKKLVHDPLFSLNHTAAMLRANINRLFRKTWNTTKKPEFLMHHINIYMYFHNQVLLKKYPHQSRPVYYKID